MSVSHLVWNGLLPICFSLSPRAVVSEHPPEPIYAMVPRVGYLAHALSSARVAEAFSLGSRRVWVESKGNRRPVGSSLPLGVHADVAGVEGGEEGVWELVVHTSDFPVAGDGEDPEYVFVDGEGEEAAEAAFKNRLKESEYIKTGSTKGVMVSLSNNQVAQLVRGVATHDLDLYNRVAPLLGGGSREDVAALKYVPLRLVFPDAPDRFELLLPVHPQTGELSTLRDAFDALLPDRRGEDISFLLHGVRLEVDDVSLFYLVNHMAYPDGFVYVAVGDS